MSQQDQKPSIEELIANHREVPPSADFIERTLAAARNLPQDAAQPEPARSPAVVRWLGIGSIAAAAALAISMVLNPTSPAAPKELTATEPATTTVELNATAIVAAAESDAEREALQLLLALEDRDTLHDEDILAFAF
ncbi:hypothetical protein [Sulfuriroseicoccus oceanibius]|uniref:Uncharacterized protein n=1 Tax=Sulfuriroseicoccus oceanibius TaxID=2707525 RepID=A0A6B3LAG8_9BACT|nr:hypothetical protein [Sulfuriroseicoccus oceanibius]QQL46211.1 hypothetical protein G3M56_006415 [Sulfuriroseicoccus oceanibius]